MSTTNLGIVEDYKLSYFIILVNRMEGVKLENLYNSIMEKKERFQFKKTATEWKRERGGFYYRVSTNTEEFKEARAAVVKKYWGLE